MQPSIPEKTFRPETQQTEAVLLRNNGCAQRPLALMTELQSLHADWIPVPAVTKSPVRGRYSMKHGWCWLVCEIKRRDKLWTLSLLLRPPPSALGYMQLLKTVNYETRRKIVEHLHNPLVPHTGPTVWKQMFQLNRYWLKNVDKENQAKHLAVFHSNTLVVIITEAFRDQMACSR